MRQVMAQNAGRGRFDLAQSHSAKKELSFAKTQQAGHLDERDNPAGWRKAGAGLAARTGFAA